ncbi:MAG TPA: hypothetical protein VIV11_04400 [Kofleriaceae bacterium]
MNAKNLIIAGCLLVSLDARAQEVNLSSLDAEPNRVHVTTGAEYGFVAGAGYSRVLPFLDRKLVVTGEVMLPWAALDVSDYRLRLGALVPIVGPGRWKLAGSIAWVLRGTESTINTMTDVGVDAALLGGFYDSRWFVAGEVGADVALTTKITHNDAYRETSHPDAMDGWYAGPGANLRAGVQAGVAFARYDVTMRVGQVRDVAGEAPLLPFYGSLALGARW